MANTDTNSDTIPGSGEDGTSGVGGVVQGVVDRATSTAKGLYGQANEKTGGFLGNNKGLLIGGLLGLLFSNVMGGGMLMSVLGALIGSVAGGAFTDKDRGDSLTGQLFNKFTGPKEQTKDDFLKDMAQGKVQAKHFTGLDVDQDKNLSDDELKPLNALLEKAKHDQNLRKQLADVIDKDGDGKITLSEVSGLLPGNLSSVNTPSAGSAEHQSPTK